MKSVYVDSDYKTWTDGIASISNVEMENYLKAGTVYWDGGFGDANNGLQTFTTPQGGSYHSGIWLLKKAYWPETLQSAPSNIVSLKDNYSVRTNGKYFFLPAAGLCLGGNFSYAGGFGNYWSSTPNVEDSAYRLAFIEGYVTVGSDKRVYGYLPMVAE